MIKKSDIYKNRRRIAWILGIACIFVTGVFLLTGGLSDSKPAWASVAEYDAIDLYKFKSLYIGDASNVGNLAGRLPLGEYRNGMELFTEKEPYGLLINYVLPEDIDFVWRLDNNACIMFSLISNLSEVTYKVTYKNETAEYSYSRSLLEERFNISFSDLGKDEKSFSDFLKDISMKIYVYPQYYASVMSSVPGIQIQSVYTGAVRNVKYSCENGVLLYWDVYSGQNPKGVKSIEVPYGTHIYWSPLVGINEFVTEDVIYVTLTDFQDDQIREKKIQVVTGENGFYTVTPTPDIVFGIGRRSQSLKPTSLNDAISQAVKGQGKSYSTGEYLVEGHVILGDDVKDNEMTVYTVVSVGWFGFENDIFTKISGSGAIPTVMRFSIDDQNGYSLLEYKEPRDGSEYSQSIKSMFPKNLHDKLFSNEFNSSLKEQQEYQAAEYLTRIGRNAQVTCDYVPKTLVDINVHASNKLFSEYGKFDEFINNCPYWIGTREKIENSVRYIYKTSQSKTEDGYDLIIFGKLTEDGTVVKEVLYKINGTEPVLIE